MQVYKEKLLQGLRQRIALAQDATFRPELDRETEKIALHRNRGKDVLERIRDEAELIEQKKYDLQLRDNLRVAEECPFQPRLDSYVNEEVPAPEQRSSRTARRSTS